MEDGKKMKKRAVQCVSNDSQDQKSIPSINDDHSDAKQSYAHLMHAKEASSQQVNKKTSGECPSVSKENLKRLNEAKHELKPDLNRPDFQYQQLSSS